MQNLIVLDDPLATLKNCGGYYLCPKDRLGLRLGPLVGYAGTYQDGKDLDENGQPKRKQFVGDVYYNFAAAEMFPAVVRDFSCRLANEVSRAFPEGIDCLVAMPMGGIVIATHLAFILKTRFVFAEKKITVLKTDSEREQSELVLDRHEIPAGSRVLMIEDVCNNFSTIDKAKALVSGKGSELLGVACLANRSPATDHDGLPVVSMLHLPTVQYRQDYEEAYHDVSVGNVVWKPKNDWARLAQAMAAAEAANA